MNTEYWLLFSMGVGGGVGMLNNISYEKAPQGPYKIQNDGKGRLWYRLQKSMNCGTFCDVTQVEFCLNWSFSAIKFGCVA